MVGRDQCYTQGLSLYLALSFVGEPGSPLGYLGRYPTFNFYKMENPTNFNITLDHLAEAETFHTFQVAYSNANSRILLPYPQVEGLQFMDDNGLVTGEWRTRHLTSSPLDDFVLTPNARIAFDLHAFVNCESHPRRGYTIELPIGLHRARFIYHVDDKREWHDFLAKKSRFAGMTQPWNGTIESNTIQWLNYIPKHVG